jgi:hypothetical protein
MTDHPGRIPDLPDPIPNEMAQLFLDADPMVQFMRLKGIPVTRENYIALGWCSQDLPERWTAEYEANLPSLLRDWSKCDPPD